MSQPMLLTIALLTVPAIIEVLAVPGVDENDQQCGMQQ